MLLGAIWTTFIAISILFGCLNGCTREVGNAAIEGAQAAVDFCLSVGGMMCLWCAVMELMRSAGLADSLAKALRPVLQRLFPDGAGSPKVLEPLSANVSANLLGLGNAATPMGIQAARAFAERGEPGRASNELCRFVVLNTASIQLLPTNVAAIRAAYGAAQPFDILPAVWISSAVSVCAGLAVARLFEAGAK